MTASIIDGAAKAPTSSSFGRFAGFGALVRKDAREWVRGKRAWVVLIVTAAFMVLTAANSWITSRVAQAVPGEVPIEKLGSLVPADNLFAAVSSQIFVMAAIFAVGGLMARDREAGTLSWVASKPVTRASIWTSKWVSSTAVLAIVAAIVPLGLTAAVVTVLYGGLPIELVVAVAAGMVAVIAFFAALSLALGTIIPGQAATIAAAFGVFALMPVLAGLIPFPIAEYLPTSILPWFAGAVSGAPVTVVTPIAWLIATAGLAVLAIRRMGRLEL